MLTGMRQLMQGDSLPGGAKKALTEKERIMNNAILTHTGHF